MPGGTGMTRAAGSMSASRANSSASSSTQAGPRPGASMRASALSARVSMRPASSIGHGERAWPCAIEPHAPQPRRGQDEPRPAAATGSSAAHRSASKSLDADRQRRFRPVLDQNGPGRAELRDRALDRDRERPRPRTRGSDASSANLPPRSDEPRLSERCSACASAARLNAGPEPHMHDRLRRRGGRARRIHDAACRRRSPSSGKAVMMRLLGAPRARIRPAAGLRSRELYASTR